MKKPWSITTTLRNPDRLRDFLIVLQNIEGEVWDQATQEKYQILLIKNRKYGYANTQFYNGLSKKQTDLISDSSKELTYNQAKDIFDTKSYEDPSMRGRQSINPLKKLGLVSIKDGKIFITSLGKLLLKKDYDFGELFFKSFIKWQIPNPDNNDYKAEDGYNIKPFVGTLHLIDIVNKKEIENGNNPKGINKQEFDLFVPTLVNYEDIDKYANEIIKLRKLLKNKSKNDQKKIFSKYCYDFAKNFLETNNQEEINKLLNNLKDYGDNALRYFRLTRYIYIHGGDYYVDLEKRRKIELNNLLSFDSGKALSFSDIDIYLDYISDLDQPKLPWETQEKLIEILLELVKQVQEYENKLSIQKPIEIKDYIKLNDTELKNYIDELRDYRRHLQEIENHNNSQGINEIEKYITILKNIYKQEIAPIALEKYVALGLHALNDALKIQPNYPVGDDNEPTFTAPAGKPDIECFYESFNAICEVTMLTGRNQWFNEGQPVMRHLRDFEEKDNTKNTYCIFIAPSLHRDTVNTFWFAVKYEYEGKPQKIIPLSLNNFVQLLEILLLFKRQNINIKHKDLVELYNNIITVSINSNTVNQWIENIPDVIKSWKEKIGKH